MSSPLRLGGFMGHAMDTLALCGNTTGTPVMTGKSSDLNSRFVKGYLRVYSVAIEGDNMEGSWTCTLVSTFRAGPT